MTGTPQLFLPPMTITSSWLSFLGVQSGEENGIERPRMSLMTDR